MSVDPRDETADAAEEALDPETERGGADDDLGDGKVTIPILA